jgi:excisionase family DNA binding protein
MAGRPDDILTAGEAARLCALSRSTLRRMVAAGRIAAWRTPGQHLRVSRQDCLDYLRSVGAVELAGRVAVHAAGDAISTAPRAQAIR